MGDRQAPSGSQENLSGHGGDADTHYPSVGVSNTYHDCTVYNVGHAENTNFGTNYGEFPLPLIVLSLAGLVPVNQQLEVRMSQPPLDALLAPIRDASYTRNRKTSPPDSDCLPGTRTNVIRRLTAWVNTSVLLSTVHILWLHGYVGCGKSAISQAVSQKFGRKGRLLASFFFYRNAGDRSKMNKFAVTLASQMVAAVPATEPFVKAAVKAESGLVTGEVSLSIQLERLVYKPFNAIVKRGLILKTLFQGPFLVVIDGLDECEDKEEVKEFINHLLDFFKRHPSTPLRFLITSRVEQHIKECLNTAGVQLDDLVAHGSEDDILIFLETSFGYRMKRDPVLAAYVKSNGQWPPRANLKTLMRHIGGSFVFASALFKYIVEPSDDGLNPITRLPLTLDIDPGLDGLYAFTVARSQRLPHFSDVIYTIALVFEPLSITAIAELLGIQTFKVLDVLVNLQAIIHIPGTDEQPVTFCHTSFRDFLTTESRSGRFFAPPSHHLYLSYRCSLVQDNPERENAATSYGIGNCENHAEKFACLLPSLREPFLQTVDALYARILAQAQHYPSFSDFLSTLALLYEPLSVEGLAELLGIQGSQVSQILANLRVIIRIQSDTSLVTFRHPSLRDFLTSKSRSGPFFAPPSYHHHLFYCCLILRDREQAETSARAYSISHLTKHSLDCLPSTGRELLSVSPFPTTLDAAYAHILAKASHLPHFLDIISIIALLFTPLSSAGIAELLSIESPAVVQVIVNLQPIIRSKETNYSLVTTCHQSLCDFLTNESRSGPFFTSPCYHLKIYYCCLGIVLERQPNETPYSPARGYSWANCAAHLDKFLKGTSEQCILEAFDQLPHIPNWQPLPDHLLSFVHILYWLFADHKYTRPVEAFHALTRCIEFLALALECNPQPDRWLREPLSKFGLPGSVQMVASMRDYYLKIQQEQATALQHIVERVETAIRAKYPSILSASQPYPNIKSCLIDDPFIEDWTPISAYRVFEWMNRRVQAVIALDEPGIGGPYYFELKFSRKISELQTRVTLRKRRLRSTNSRPEVGENGGV